MSQANSTNTLLQHSDSIVDPSTLPTPAELTTKPSIVPHDESNTIINATPAAAAAAGQPGTGRRLLVCYNGSDESEVAWQWTLKNVQPDDHVFVLDVLPVNSIDPVVLVGITDIASTIAVEKNLQMLRALRKKATADVTAKAKDFEGKCRGVQVHVVHGEARQSIPRCADFHKCDTIVLGRRELHGWKRLTSSGSVSSQVVANAKQTVVIAKA